jgi:transposase
LETWSHSRILPRRQVLRAQVVLLAAEGRSNVAIADQLGVSRPTVLQWRARFAQAGLEGLEEAPGRGRPFTYDQALVDKVLALTMTRPPRGSTHWSTRTLAQKLGVSAMTVQRIWREHRLQPHRSRAFKFSDDPQLVEKVRDVVGLYLHPPEKEVVLCVDEKSQIQALDRTQPLLPLRPGQVERHTHDYVRHGTTTLFAALDVASGEVTGRCYARHRHQEFLRFLQLLDQSYPQGELHLVLDNASTHRHPVVREWLRQSPRFHLHFTPSSASWMNQVETWFSLLQRRALRRGVFRSLTDLRAAIERFQAAWNDQCKPFAWVKTPDQILAKAMRQGNSVTGH